MLPRTLLALAAVAAALAPASSAATRTVGVRDDFFTPARLTIAKGDSVRWIWQGGGRRRHNVASSAFGDSGYKRRGSFSVRFARAGSYTYFCFLHEGMDGTVVVRR
jgi:plastocyanin